MFFKDLVGSKWKPAGFMSGTENHIYLEGWCDHLKVPAVREDVLQSCELKRDFSRDVMLCKSRSSGQSYRPSKYKLSQNERQSPSQLQLCEFRSQVIGKVTPREKNNCFFGQNCKNARNWICKFERNWRVPACFIFRWR